MEMYFISPCFVWLVLIEEAKRDIIEIWYDEKNMIKKSLSKQKSLLTDETLIK